MIRGALVGLIYHRSLNVQSNSHDVGSSVSLISTDVGNLETVGEMLHECWAQFLEVIVGTAILASQVGWLFPVPFVIIICSFLNPFEVSV
jgi:ATP-binding cassette subfamily C (CFTR/MRP) protein 1